MRFRAVRPPAPIPEPSIASGTDGLHDSPLEQAGLELLVPVSAARARKMRRVQTDPDQMTEQGRELVAIGLG